MNQLLFQHFAKLAEDPKAHIDVAALKRIERDEEVKDSLDAIGMDLVNTLPEELDIKVTYRDAVSLPTSRYSASAELI